MTTKRYCSRAGNVYIMNPPKNTTSPEGQKVKLQCQAEGYPDNITYRWYRDGVDIQLFTSLNSRSQVLSDGTFVINGVLKSDSGWYKCRPSNNLGTPPEAPAYLNVTCEFKFQGRLILKGSDTKLFPLRMMIESPMSSSRKIRRPYTMFVE